MQGLQGLKIALLIDFDNVILGLEDPPFDAELVVNALRSRGIVVMGRAYGDWYRHNRHRRKLMEQGIELVETPVFGPVIKNSADIRIVIDALDIAFSQAHIDAFCLVSGDSDFLPLIKRLQMMGKQVMVIAGNKFTSKLVQSNCNEYISYENLLAESVGATEDASTLEGAFQLLRRTLVALSERGMDVRSSTVKQMMLQLNPTFSERNFGCSQFKQFLDRAMRAGVIRGGRDGASGEYTVRLTSDAEEPAAPAPPTVAEPAALPAPVEAREGEWEERRNGRRRRRRGRDHERDQAPPVVPVAATPGDGQPSDEGALEAALEPVVEGVSPVPELTPEEIAEAETAAAAGTPTGVAGHGPVMVIEDDEDELLGGPERSSFLGRHRLRRGRLRFSAKSGGTHLAAETAPAGAKPVAPGEAPPAELQPAEVPEIAAPDVAELPSVEPETAPESMAPGAPMAEGAAPEAVEPEAETAPSEGAATTEAAAEAPTKKRATRSRRRKSAAEKSAERAAPEGASAEATGEAAPSATAPAEGVAEAAPAEAPSAEATHAEAAPATADSAAEATPEAPAKKPARRRRGGHKKAETR